MMTSDPSPPPTVDRLTAPGGPSVSDEVASPALPALDHLAVLADLQAQFLATIPLVSPDAPVSSCGDWTVHDLVEHLGNVHHWAAAQARRVPTTPLDPPSDLSPFYATTADELLTTLHSLDPDGLAWLLDDEPGSVRFWHRRQLHETLIHLWDLRTAGGLPLEVAPTIWADTIDEVVTFMQPRQERLSRMEPLTHSLTLESTDAPSTWQLGRTSPNCNVRGSVSALALLLWRRVSTNDPSLTLTGDRATLRDAKAVRLTP